MEQTGGAPTQAVPVAETEVMPENMTGEQAKVWVESQKGKVAPKGVSAKDPYLADPKKEQSTQEAVKEAVAEAKRKLKIDDQEIDEDEVIKIYRERKGHQQAANKKMQEALAARKQVEEALTMLKDPEKVFDVLQKLGHDARTLAEKRLVAELQEEMMDPRDRELQKLRAERQAEEAEKARVKAEQEAKNIQILKEKFAKDYTEQFKVALTETALPATKGTVAEMAKYIARATEIGFKMTPKEAAQLVREDMLDAQRRLIGDADGEMLIKLLGDEVANKVRKWDTSRLKSPEPPRVRPEDQGAPKERRVPHKRMSAKEWREFNRR